MKRNSIFQPMVAGLALWGVTLITPTFLRAQDVQPEPVAPAPEVKPAELISDVEPRPAAEAPPAPDVIPSAPETAAPPDGLIRLNFRGVPLEMVLNHLSEAAGFIILQETPVEGDVDVWSNQPLTKEEAVTLLNTILNRNGYAAIRNDRMLTIVKLEEARKRNIPVQKGNDAEAIPQTEEMVTQIIPVRYANALALTQNLQPLLPTYAAMTANESGNSLVLTDTQANIRRMVQIVEALDTSISSISTIRVFPLRYADSKELAEAVKELFQPPQQNNNNDRRSRFFSRFGGRGGAPGFPGGDGGEGGGAPVGTGDNIAREAASRVITVADERVNALIVAAPDEFIPTIEQLVKEVDVRVDDLTELRVFHLNNADPAEMASLFQELFPDEDNTSQNNNRGGGFPFFRGGGDRGGRFQNNANQESERMKKLGRVQVVPDSRTSSLIVSAASELMPQIAAMIEQLDGSPAKKQKVFVYSLENADVTQVEQILRDMFERTNTQQNRNRSSANQNSALSNRQNQQNNNRGGGNSGFGNSGFGNSGFGNTGGFGGGQTFR